MTAVTYLNYSVIAYLPDLPASGGPVRNGYINVGYSESGQLQSVDNQKKNTMKSASATKFHSVWMTSEAVITDSTSYFKTLAVTVNPNNASYPWWWCYKDNPDPGGHGDTSGNAYNVNTGEYKQSVYASEAHYKGEYIEISLSSQYFCLSCIKIKYRHPDFLPRAPDQYKVYGQNHDGTWENLIYETSVSYGTDQYHTSKIIEYLGDIQTSGFSVKCQKKLKAVPMVIC